MQSNTLHGQKKPQNSLALNPKVINSQSLGLPTERSREVESIIARVDEMKRDAFNRATLDTLHPVDKLVVTVLILLHNFGGEEATPDETSAKGAHFWAMETVRTLVHEMYPEEKEFGKIHSSGTNYTLSLDRLNRKGWTLRKGNGYRLTAKAIKKLIPTDQ